MGGLAAVPSDIVGAAEVDLGRPGCMEAVALDSARSTDSTVYTEAAVEIRTSSRRASVDKRSADSSLDRFGTGGVEPVLVEAVRSPLPLASESYPLEFVRRALFKKKRKPEINFISFDANFFF